MPPQTLPQFLSLISLTNFLSVGQKRSEAASTLTGQSPLTLLSTPLHSLQSFRLVGLVVKASASRAEGPGFESRQHRDFFGVESYQ